MPVLPGGAQFSIANGVREFVRSTPNAIVVIDRDRHLTYGELGERAAWVGSALQGLGLEPGERVAVLLGNQLEYPEVACGIAMAGLVMVPPQSTPDRPRVPLHPGALGLPRTDPR